MPKRRRRLTKRREKDYARVPITKEAEEKLVRFMKDGPLPAVATKKDGEEEHRG